jgi:hypothetical protein
MSVKISTLAKTAVTIAFGVDSFDGDGNKFGNGDNNGGNSNRDVFF